MMGAEAVRSAPPKEVLSMYYCIIKSIVHSLITYFNLDLNFTVVNGYSFLRLFCRMRNRSLAYYGGLAVP